MSCILKTPHTSAAAKLCDYTPSSTIAMSLLTYHFGWSGMWHGRLWSCQDVSLLALEGIRIKISYPGGQPLTLGQVSFAPEKWHFQLCQGTWPVLIC
jgi:hypothetical protein